MPYSNKSGLPSTTQILRPFIDSDWFTPESRDRGQAVHAAAAAYLKGLYVVKLPGAWGLYFDSIRRWVDDMVDSVVMVETRLIDKGFGYCGQLDLCAVLKGDTAPSQIDWKTGQTAFRWWQLQSASYRHLLEVNGTETGRGLSVMPKPDGSGCRVVEHSDYSSDMAIFTACLSAWRFFYAT